MFLIMTVAFECRVLLDSQEHLTHVMDAVDAVVGNLGPIPAPVEAMLFQHDIQNDSNAAVSLAASAKCPRIGLVLSMQGDQNPLTSQLPDQSFNILECVLSESNLHLGCTGTSYVL